MSRRLGNFKSLLAVGVAASPLLAVAPSPVLAQDTSAGGREEIVVTARRREESLQDVPVAVTAISGDRLADVGAQDITYLTQSVPNTTLEVSRGTNSTLSAFIRGVGQQDPVAGFESGVGIYVDDVYLNRPQSAVLDIYDVERVEVLRGPQGTLYGRNTIGGALKYVSRRLGDEAMLRLRASGGTYGERNVVATGVAPIGEDFALGATVAYLAHEGYGKNLTTGEDNYDKNLFAFRVSGEYDSGPLFFRLSGDWLHDTSNSKGGHRLIPGVASGAPVLDDIYDTQGGLPGETDAKAYGGAIHIELELSDTLTAKNIASIRRDETTQIIDFDALPAIDLDVPAMYENKQFTEEFQLLYEGDAVSGVAGFYYIDANAADNFDVRLSTLVPGLNANTIGDVDTKSWSFFADMTFDLESIIGLQGVEFAVGGRYTSDKRASHVLRRTLLGDGEAFGGTPLLLATTSDFTGEAKFTDFSPRVSLSWSPNSDHNFYVSYSQGFKGGSFDPRGQTSSVFASNLDVDGDGDVDNDDVFEFMKFEPEEVDTYEAGWKSQLAEGRITSNLAFFYSDYTNVQIPGSQGGTDPISGLPTFIGVTTNAGAAELYGIEWEGSALVFEDFLGAGDNLDLSWGGGWIHAEYTEFEAGIPPVDFSDVRVVQNTPEFSGAVSATYSQPMQLFGKEGELLLINTASYKSRTHQFEVPNAFLDQGGYGLYDASLVWNSSDGRLQIGVHGKNLLDREYRIAGYTFVAQNQDGSYITNPADGSVIPTLGTEGVLTAFYGPPRTITGTIQVQF